MEQKEYDKGNKKVVSHQKSSKPTIIDKGCYGITRKTKHGQESSLALTLKLRNGEHVAIWYYEIISPIKFPHQNKLEFQTTNLKVSVTGENLQDLFDSILEHKVVWIKEPESEFESKLKNGEVWVKTVLVEA